MDLACIAGEQAAGQQQQASRMIHTTARGDLAQRSALLLLL
jgi:hypothetical protein